MNISTLFQETVWQYYRQNGRHDLPWRLPAEGGFDPYRIVVSEIMLQQTQVHRVLPKYLAFTQTFPHFAALAAAPLSQVIAEWNGLGYNRRAKFLWQAAQNVMEKHDGNVPADASMLVSLPGIGPNTAGAIMAYAFNRPVVFVETNIRTVYIHHFFADQQNVDDKALVPVIEETLPTENPREWYWALMDYGTHLKQSVGNVARASRSYSKQSPFEGSRRQLRGQILRTLLNGPQTTSMLAERTKDSRLTTVLADLTKEGLITNADGIYQLRA